MRFAIGVVLLAMLTFVVGGAVVSSDGLDVEPAAPSSIGAKLIDNIPFITHFKPNPAMETALSRHYSFEKANDDLSTQSEPWYHQAIWARDGSASDLIQTTKCVEPHQHICDDFVCVCVRAEIDGPLVRATILAETKALEKTVWRRDGSVHDLLERGKCGVPHHQQCNHIFCICVRSDEGWILARDKTMSVPMEDNTEEGRIWIRDELAPDLFGKCPKPYHQQCNKVFCICVRSGEEEAAAWFLGG